MIAADSSTWIAYIQGETSEDTGLLDRALADRLLLMPPAVLTELLSDPALPPAVGVFLSRLPLIEPAPGYWHRAGSLRALILGKTRKAALGDALIAQSCIDRGLPLLTRDRDFKSFARFGGLDLVIG